MKTLRVLTLLLLSGMSAAQAQTGASAVPGKIEALRKQRETAISEAIAKANADYAAALDKMKTLYASDPSAAQAVAQERTELAKVAVMTLPPGLRITAAVALPLAGVATKPRVKPQIHKPEELAHYLIGSRWSFFGNGQFIGDPVVLEFTGPETATLDGKDRKWRVMDKAKIWLEGDKEYTFGKDYVEFTGGWPPNPKDRNSGRLLQ